MGGKGSGPKKKCPMCKEPLVCASCGADLNDKAMVRAQMMLPQDQLDTLKAEADEQGVSLSELMRRRVLGGG